MASDPKSLSGNANGVADSGNSGAVGRVPANAGIGLSTLAPPIAPPQVSAVKAPPVQRPPLGGMAPRIAAPEVGEGEQETSFADLSWPARFERLWKQTSSCLSSLAIHAALIIALGLWAAAQEERPGLPALLATTAGEPDPLVTNMNDRQADVTLTSESVAENSLTETANELSSQIKAQANSVKSENTGATPVALADVGIAVPVGGGDLFGAFDADAVGSLGGRGKAMRAKLVAEGGGTQQSEDAVARGLRWLQAHQNPDGSWRFDLKDCPCKGRCRNSGDYAAPVPSTAMALLAFLGNGQTQREGEYQETVQKGLYYLCSQMTVTSQGGSFMDTGGKGMYSHGLAAIVLSEAYAMTREQNLEEYAQKSIDFIVSAQDKRGGGWRYQPGMPGDTTVSGWQIMALKSAQMAYLRVPQDTIYRATRFLDSVEFGQGAQYQYQPKIKEGKELTTTSVGLLCRMYTGWSLDHPGIEQGVKVLARPGPSMDNMYYNYYATQVMHQWGGAEWRDWNYRMRDYLVRTQSQEGHEAGSWQFNGSWSGPGGRLYNTALAIMTLEVYYRHLPLYGPNAVNESNQ